MLSQLILAQAKHETNNFTSPVFLNQNNAFGMKEAFKRKDQPGRSEEGKTFRTYDSVTDSVKDLIDLYEWNNLDPTIKTSYDFSTALKKVNYYGNSNTVQQYSNGIARWLNE